MVRTASLGILLVTLPLAIRGATMEGGCSCGVLAVETFKPIIEHTLQRNVTCDVAGAEKCLQLCTVLAKTARDKAPNMICKKLNVNVENLKVAVYSTACDVFAFIRVQSIEYIRCNEGKISFCAATVSLTDDYSSTSPSRSDSSQSVD